MSRLRTVLATLAVLTIPVVLPAASNAASPATIDGLYAGTGAIGPVSRRR